MQKTWDDFFFEKAKKILGMGGRIIDVGSGLRILSGKGNRYDDQRAAILGPLLAGVDYQIMDPVPDYGPDIIGDIQSLPFRDGEVGGFFCLAVLEHVPNPFLAMSEIYRTLRPGGSCLVYVPFLFYYHAEPGYYHDYWRFSEDGIRRLCGQFSQIEICPVRGPVATWLHLSPFGRLGWIKWLGDGVDWTNLDLRKLPA